MGRLVQPRPAALRLRSPSAGRVREASRAAVADPLTELSKNPGTVHFYLNAVDEQLRVGDDRESVGIILAAGRNETVAKLALHRVYAPIAVSTWQAGAPAPELPPVEISEDVPADLHELAELDDVRARLIERVTNHQPPATDEQPTD